MLEEESIPLMVEHQMRSIEYVTIASTGNAQDFGDISGGRIEVWEVVISTRGLMEVEEVQAQTVTLIYITIASTGNAQDFGDLTR